MDPTERVQPAAFEDGLGTRYTVEAGGESLEVLTVRPELAAIAAFEPAVRERAARLGGFLRACYGHVRSVERVEAEAPALAVVSERTEGARLSRLLTLAEERRIPLEIDAALCLIRQLAQAVSLLHEYHADVAHGAIAPERLVVTAHARLVVTDYVFGSALAALELSRERYWTELRIAVPASAGAPRLDRRADVAQVGAVALAAILGRPLRDDEWPSKAPELLASLQAATPSGREPLLPALRAWLNRALQLDHQSSFASAIEARADLEQVLGESDYTAAPAALQQFLARCRTVDTTSEPPLSVKVPTAAAAPPRPESKTVSAPPGPAGAREGAASSALQADAPTPPPAASGNNPPPRELTREPALAAHQPRSAFDPDVTSRAAEPFKDIERAALPLPPAARRPPARGLLVVAAVVLIAMTSGVTLATWRLFSGPGEDVERPGTLTVTTSTDGVLVVVDGFTAGRTPLTTSLPPGDHTVEVVHGSVRRTFPVTMAPGGTVSQFVEVAATPVNTGKVQVRTDPPGARVSVDGQYFGSSPITVDGLAPGVHVLQVGNERDRVTERVTIEAGVTASVVVPLRNATAPAAAWITVTTPAEVQVFENGNLIGTSRNGRIMVPPGRHQIELVNEALGYRSMHGIQVLAGAATPIRPAWPTGTVAINALPWAEVRIGGDRIGETPLGSVTLPIGEHEVVFRHPELGEQRHRVLVTLTGTARLSVDMRK